MKCRRNWLAFSLLLCMSNGLSAARYWISNVPSNWNNTANWSASSGGAGGASIPTTTDDVRFDANGVGNCNFDVTISIRTIIVNGYTGTLIQGSNSITTSNLATFTTGTFLGGSGNITIGAVYTLSGTAFTSTSGILELNGTTAAFTSGTFNHNNGTVRCRISGTQTMSGVSQTFYNLEFAGNTSTYNITSTGNVTALSNLLITGSLPCTLNTGTIDVKADINITNTASGGGGTALVRISGTGAQIFNGSSIVSTGALPRLTVDKPSGTLDLINFPTVANTFTYTAGTVNAGSSTVCFTTGSVASYSIIGSVTLNNIVFNAATALTITVSAATTLTATGNMTMAGTANLIMNTGTIAVQANIIDNNSAIGGGGNATILINGTGAQSLTSTGVIDQGKLPSVRINKGGGNLTLPSLITVVGGWDYLAGTVDVSTNNSTAVFENTLTISGTHSLNNIIFNAIANYTFTVAAGTTLTALGNTSIMGSGNAIFNTGNINLLGNLTLTNTATAGGGSTVISFTGSANQSIISSVLINQSSLPAVTINKTGGTLVFPSLITVRGDWTYTAGAYDVSTNNSTIVFAGPLVAGAKSITGTHTLNNVIFQGNTNNTFNVNTGTVLTLTGILTTTGSANVVLNTTVAGATAIQAQGDINFNNTSTGSGGTGLILINGTGDQAFTGTAAALRGQLPFITVQKLSGTLTISGVISVSRTWTWSSGIVDAVTNSSSVVFGGNNLNIVSAGMNFYNVTVSSNTSTLGNDMTVEGNLTINGSGVLAAGSRTINLSGNWTNRGTAGFTEATSTVRFNGSSWQNIITTGTENFTNVILDNPASGMLLQNAIAVASSLNMTAGNIDFSSNGITLGVSATAPGILSYTSGVMFNSGYFSRWFARATIPAWGIAGMFPVGTAADYRPFNVSVPAIPTTGGTITVRYTDATTNTITSFPDGSDIIMVRKDLNWAVSTSGLAGGSYNTGISGTGYGSVGAVSDLRLTLAGSVTGLPGTNAGTLTNPQVNRTAITQANLNNTFYLGSINSVNSTLPVSLISFTATALGDEVLLKWQTANEINNDHFTVQRSADAWQWKNILTVRGREYSDGVVQYNASDPFPPGGVSYYRLQQTDRDGRHSYSVVRSIQITRANNIRAYPNPASHEINITCDKDVQFINITSFSGRPANVPLRKTSSSIILQVGHLPAGIYVVHLRGPDGVRSAVSFMKL